MTTPFEIDWSTIPAPSDDGAVDHLPGLAIPSIALPATDGSRVDLSILSGRTIVYAYPRTGEPSIPLPDGWNMIPGARGCTPQSCAFRDHYSELQELGVKHLFGLSTQGTAYQQKVATRLHLPFPLLSDNMLQMVQALALPTLQVSGMTLMKRFTLVIDDAKITHIFYPIFPPDRNATDVIEWLRS